MRIQPLQTNLASPHIGNQFQRQLVLSSPPTQSGSGIVRMGLADWIPSISQHKTLSHTDLIDQLQRARVPWVRRSAADMLGEIAGQSSDSRLIRVIASALNDRLQIDPRASVRGSVAEALGKTALNRYISGLQNALQNDQSFFVRACAANALSTLGDSDSLPTIRGLLTRSNHPDIKSRVISALGNLKDYSSAHSFCAALSHSHPNVRSAGARSIGQIKATSMAPNLILSASDSQPSVRASSLWALGMMEVSEPATISTIESHLNPGEEPYPVVRASAAEALGNLGSLSSGDRLANSLDDRHPLVREKAAGALGVLGLPKYLPQILNFIRKEDDEGPLTAGLIAIGKIGNASATPVIKEFIAHPSQRVRAAAVWSFLQLESEFFKDTWASARRFWHNPPLPEPIVIPVKSRMPGTMSDELAFYDLLTSQIFINLDLILTKNVFPYVRELETHEVGHPMVVPVNRQNHMALARIVAEVSSNQATVDYILNLFADLVVNNRLFSDTSLKILELYRALAPAIGSPLYHVYMRSYEILACRNGFLVGPKNITPEMESDAAEIARIINTYGDLIGLGLSVAARQVSKILIKYFRPDDLSTPIGIDRAGDAMGGSSGETLLPSTERSKGHLKGISIKGGLIISGSVPELTEEETDISRDENALQDLVISPSGTTLTDSPEPKGGDSDGDDSLSLGHHVPLIDNPKEFIDLVRKLGIDNRVKALVIYYRAIAGLYEISLKSFEELLVLADPLSAKPWQITDPVKKLDAYRSLMKHGTLIPGVFSVQRDADFRTETDPLAKLFPDLEIWLDTSGSTPDPAGITSPLVIGTMIATHSAIGRGKKVKMVNYDDANTFIATDGFIEDLDLLDALSLTRISRRPSTTVPVNHMEEQFPQEKAHKHILIFSDSEIQYLLNSPDIAKRAVELSTGADVILNDPGKRSGKPNLMSGTGTVAALEALGYKVHVVGSFDDIPEVCQAISNRLYNLEKQ